MPDNCANCRFFEPTQSETGRCRRFPPLVNPAWGPNDRNVPGGFNHPVVAGSAWCGEFQSAGINPAATLPHPGFANPSKVKTKK